jgi:hypothetical protein
MTGHDYLNLAVAAVFLTINLLGSTFAIKRLAQAIRKSSVFVDASVGHVAPSKHQL